MFFLVLVFLVSIYFHRYIIATSTTYLKGTCGHTNMKTCNMKNMLFIYFGVLFLSFQVSHVSSATNTISTNQPLSRLKTIVSSGDNFELGLFNPTPGIYGYFYIGMWYKQVSPRTIVWVANRESPARGIRSHNCLLKISNGNLILHNNFNNGTIWSTGVNYSRSTDVEAVLLDSGNLVLRDGPTSSATVLWQSFDHPSDTWLPGAKIKLGSQLLTSWKGLKDPSSGRYSLEFDHHSKSLITVWNGSTKLGQPTTHPRKITSFVKHSFVLALLHTESIPPGFYYPREAFLYSNFQVLQ